MNNTEVKKIDSTSITINNTIDDKYKYSHISQKQIFDRTSNSVSGFVVLSTPTFKKQDWISVRKLMDINSKIDKLPLDYALKATIKGDYDESKKPQDGKALHLTLDGDNYKFEIYTQVYGREWQSSHTHTIDKALFNAYVIVVHNDIAVNEAEKDQKSPDDFSLNLE
ncbi:MAG: hypothetical protein GQ531_03145 [Sulfurovum sp.]|nr:hypothetical protein [Sulfurovum sp.]